MVNILLVTDDMSFSVDFLNFISKQVNTKLIGIACNSEEMYSMVINLLPDILIIDLDMSKMSGIQAIDKVNNFNLVRKPYITVLSRDIEELSHILVNKSIYRVFNKTEEYEDILSSIYEIDKTNNKEHIKEYIDSVLLKLGFNPSNKGYKYLKECIMIILQENSIPENFNKHLYSKVALKFNTDLSTIKTSIDKSLNSMWRYCDKVYVNEYLNIFDNRKPTIKYLIIIIVKKSNSDFVK